MPAELTSDQLAELREALQHRFDELWAEIRAEAAQRKEETFGRLASEAPDIEDQSVADELVDLELATIDRQVEEMREIQAAWFRMKEGTYGECIDCHAPIGYERLKAFPTAQRCIVCQDAYEKTHAEPPHPSL